jgi:hypothetical protein
MSESRNEVCSGLDCLAAIQLLTSCDLNVFLGECIGCPVTSTLAEGQVVCLAVDREERDKVWIEPVESDAVAAKRVDLTRSFDDADLTGEQPLRDGNDFLSIVEGDDFG